MSTSVEEMPHSDAAPVEPFHIVCDQETNDPVMWFGICVDNDQMKQYLRDNEVLNPHLLVVVTTPGGTEVDRRIVPLTQGVAHYAFRRAGEFKVMAAVVHEPKGDVRQLRRLFTYRNSNGQYACSVVNIDGKLHSRFEWREEDSNDDDEPTRVVSRHSHVSTETVVVHANNFAKERAKWRTALVSTFFKSKGRDECNWRKRWLASLALAVIWLPVQYLVKTVGLILYGVTGYVYGLDMQEFVRPGRRGTILHTFENVKNRTWWWFKRTEEWRGFEPRNPFWVIGFTLTVIWAAVSLVLSAKEDMDLQEAMAFTARIAGGIVLLFVLVVIIMVVADVINDRRGTDEHKAQKQAKRDAKELAKLERLKAKRGDVERQLADISCNASGQPMTIDLLLKRRRNSRVVIWNRTKDAVCQPFQE